MKRLLEASVPLPISSASLAAFFNLFSFQKHLYFTFSKTDFNDRFYYYSFTNYSQSHSNIKFNQSFHNKYVDLISCS